MNYVISCDCATHIFGWCVMNTKDYTIVDYGEIKSDDSDTLKRIDFMVDEMEKIIHKYKNHLRSAIVEDVPRSKVNIETTVVLSKLNGAILHLLHSHNLPTTLVYPTTWQSKLNFQRGIDTKLQSVNWVNKKYNLGLLYVSKKSKKNQDNISDPIAMACVVLGNYDMIAKKGRRSRINV